MLLTIFLAIVFCAAMALMLISCVAFIQDNILGLHPVLNMEVN